MADYALLSLRQVMTGESSGYGVFVSDEETKLYCAGYNAPIYQYTMSTPGDLSTAVYTGVKDIYNSTYARYLNDLFVSPDGLNLYVTTGTLKFVTQYSMSTPHDISTLAYVGRISVSAKVSSVRSVWFSPDGTKMFITSAATGYWEIHQYSLSTPWLVSTAVWAATYDLWYSGTPYAWNGSYIVFNDVGSEVYILPMGTEVRKVAVDPAFTVSGIVQPHSVEIDLPAAIGGDFYPQGLFVNKANTKLYAHGFYSSGNYIAQFSISSGPPPVSVFWTNFNGLREEV